MSQGQPMNPSLHPSQMFVPPSPPRLPEEDKVDMYGGDPYYFNRPEDEGGAGYEEAKGVTPDMSPKAGA